MTQNQIAYWQLQETKRNNRAQLSETTRSNLSRERETRRSNRANETNTITANRNNLLLGLLRQNETTRHDVASEGLESRRLAQDRAYQSSQILINSRDTLTRSLAQRETMRNNTLQYTLGNQNLSFLNQHYLRSDSENARSNRANELIKRGQLNLGRNQLNETIRYNNLQSSNTRRGQNLNLAGNLASVLAKIGLSLGGI